MVKQSNINLSNLKKDEFILSVFLFLILVMRFFLVPEYSSLFNSVYMVWSLLVFLLALLRLILLKLNEKSESLNWNVLATVTLVLLVISFLLIVILNVTNKGFTQLGWTNLRKVIDAFWPAPFFIWLVVFYKGIDLFLILNYVVKTMNIYFWINVPLIFLEHFTGTFMVSRFLQVNAYLSDQVTGLIGLNGTAIMSLYWVSLLVGNMYIYVNIKSKQRLIIMATEFGIMFFFAQMYSEIKNFIPTVIVVVLVFYLIQMRVHSSGMVIRNILFGSGILGSVGFIVYSISSSFRELVIHFVLLYTQLKMDPSSGSDIRIHTLWVAITQIKGLGFNIDFTQQSYAPQLDVISLNVLIVYGGFSLAVIVLLLMAHILAIIVGRGNSLSLFWLDAGFFLLMLYVSVISVPFQDSRLCFFVYLIALFYQGTIQRQHKVGLEL